MKEIEKMLSIRQASERLDVLPVTILRWIKSGKLQAFRLPNGYWRIRLTDLDRLLKKDG